MDRRPSGRDVLATVLAGAGLMSMLSCDGTSAPETVGSPPGPADASSAPPPAPRPVGESDPAVAPGPFVVDGPVHDALPRRVWWRYAPRGTEETFVSDRPGGDRLPGTWGHRYFCDFDGVPHSVTCGEAFSATEFDGMARDSSFADYWHTEISTERDGEMWRLYCRSADPPDPGFTDEERRLVGTWEHVQDGTTIQLELLEGGSGRGSDGTKWEWISAERGLEMRVERSDSETRTVWHVTAFVLAEDRRSYRGLHDSTAAGRRIDLGGTSR